MEFQELVSFAKWEHERLVTHHKVKGDPKTIYTMLAKLMEELGELSEAILTVDALQRRDKLTEKDEAMKNLEAEFADVLFVTLILAQELHINVTLAFKEKMRKIKARKY